MSSFHRNGLFSGLLNWTCFSAVIRFAAVGHTQQIINAGIMYQRQFNKYLRRNIHITALIIAVNSLTAIKQRRHFSLRHILIFSQITYSAVHIIT